MPLCRYLHFKTVAYPFTLTAYLVLLIFMLNDLLVLYDYFLLLVSFNKVVFVDALMF